MSAVESKPVTPNEPRVTYKSGVLDPVSSSRLNLTRKGRNRIKRATVGKILPIDHVTIPQYKHRELASISGETGAERAPATPRRTSEESGLQRSQPWIWTFLTRVSKGSNSGKENFWHQTPEWWQSAQVWTTSGGKDSG